MSQLLKSTEPAKVGQSPTGFSGNPLIEAALAKATASLNRQEAELSRAAQAAAREQAQAEEDARHRRSRTVRAPRREAVPDFCSC